MQVLFTNQFAKDVRKIKDKDLAYNIEQVIALVKNATDISGISDLKKLKGFRNAYRIRIGQYRLGVYIAGKSVEFVCFMHRKEIYRYFP